MSESDEITLREAAAMVPTPACTCGGQEAALHGLPRADVACPFCDRSEATFALDAMLAASRAGKTVR